MQIRALDFGEEGEVFTVAAFSLLTILETLPQARRDPRIVPNFSIDEMADMYLSNRHNPDHRYWVAVDEDGEVVGHAIALMRTDEAGVRHGYSYTRYVLPAHRRKGLARRFLNQARTWWHEQGAAYVLAHTHPSNQPLRTLFGTAGFVVVEERTAPWPSVLLRCEGAALCDPE